MRLFIAILFEEPIIKSLTQLQERWREIGVRGRFAPEQNLHLTLAFIGEYGSAEPVLEIMDTVPLATFSLKLDGIGNFGDICWVGIEKNAELSKYVSRLRKALAANNIPYDKKKFSPHITLVRKAVLNCEMEELLQNPPSGTMKVKSIDLMSSTRGKNGMIYTSLGCVEAKDYSLGGELE